MSELILTENSVDRSSPASGKTTLYPMTDGHWYVKDSAGNKKRVSAPSEVNTIRVGQGNEYETIYDAITYLGTLSTTDTVRILIENGNYEMSDTCVIDLTMPVWFDCSKGAFFNAHSGLLNKDMFDIRSEFYLSGCYLEGDTLVGWKSGTTASFFKCATEGVYVELVDVVGNGAKYGVSIEADIEFFQFNFTATNCNRGVRVNSNGTTGALSVDIEVGDFITCDYSIDLVKAYNIDFFANAIKFRHTLGTETAFKYDRANVTYINLIVQNSNLNTLGYNTSGVDFTNAADADIEFIGNLRTKDSRALAKINVTGNVTGQWVNANTWTKATFTNTSAINAKFSVADNKLTYLSTHIRDIVAHICCNIVTTSQPCTVDVAIIKNGNTAVLYGKMQNYADVNNRPFPMASNALIQDVSKDDYFEIWLRPTATETIIIQDLNWLMEAK